MGDITERVPSGSQVPPEPAVSSHDIGTCGANRSMAPRPRISPWLSNWRNTFSDLSQACVPGLGGRFLKEAAGTAMRSSGVGHAVTWAQGPGAQRGPMCQWLGTVFPSSANFE